MTLGRLSIHRPHWGFEYSVGICGCKILETPIATFTWHDKRCTCSCCGRYVCKCYTYEGCTEQDGDGSQ